MPKMGGDDDKEKKEDSAEDKAEKEAAVSHEDQYRTQTFLKSVVNGWKAELIIINSSY